jgi:nitrilase
MRVAAAQAHPAWLDPARGTELVTDWLARAAAEGSSSSPSGRPSSPATRPGCHDRRCPFEDAKQKRAYAAYLDAAVELDGPDVAGSRRRSPSTGVFTYLGITERGTGPASGTVFATLVAIDPARGVVSAHRKLRPTYEERLVWGPGDGHGLRVHALPSGVRVGGLNCWENWMPQARTALYAGGEDLHVSCGRVRRGNTTDITRFVAREGRVFSLAAGGLLTLGDVPTDFPAYDELAEAGGVHQDGGSAVAAPDGSVDRRAGGRHRAARGRRPRPHRGPGRAAELRPDRPLRTPRRPAPHRRPSTPRRGRVP